MTTINYKLYCLMMKLHIKKLQLLGYIGKDLEPLKCPHCKCKELEKDESFTDEAWGTYYECEFTLKCKKCGKRAGHWAYGSWLL